jgi:hypothetical protein
MAPLNRPWIVMLLLERGVLFLQRGALLIQRAWLESELEYLRGRITRLELSNVDSRGHEP